MLVYSSPEPRKYTLEKSQVVPGEGGGGGGGGGRGGGGGGGIASWRPATQFSKVNPFTPKFKKLRSPNLLKRKCISENW